MTEEEIQEKLWREQTTPFFRALGEFIVRFERVGGSMAGCITAMLDRSGLKNQKITQIVLAGVTADPLRNLFESLAAETGWIPESEQKNLRDLIHRFQKLTAERNDIVHGAWLLDPYNYVSPHETFRTARGSKYHKNKTGAATKALEKSVRDLELHINEAKELRNAIDSLCVRYVVFDGGTQVALKHGETSGFVVLTEDFVNKGS